jgi:2-hydroxy-6-oxonona-2,4-dienedioate hydrolase
MITEEQYRSITSPALVVWASHDPTATPEEGRQIECGHWPQFEDTATFNRLHIDFLLGR